MLEKLKKFDTHKNWENGYLIIYAMIVIQLFLKTTMFEIPWPPKIGLVFYFFIMCYTLAKLIFHKEIYSNGELLLAIFILISFIGVSVIADYSILFELAFLIVGAKNVSMEKILKVFCVIGTIIMIAAFAASELGFIENLQYWKGLNKRFAFGILYPTDFAAHIFYLLLCYIVIRDYKIKIWNMVIFAVLEGIILFGARAYTSFACIAIFMLMVLVVKLYVRKTGNDGICKLQKSKLVKSFILIPPLLSALFIIMTNLYNVGNELMQKADQILSLRLYYSSIGLNKYGVKLFGQNIEEKGWGTSVEERPDYFFLDDSYIRILLEYGIVVFAIIIIMLMICMKKSIDHGNILLLCAFAVIALHCFMEHHLLEIEYNPFICCLFADLKMRCKNE